ncbi:MAG: clostripain [Spirochaetota bacterium]|nr:clostripain [Spirochaetota bacterium]
MHSIKDWKYMFIRRIEYILRYFKYFNFVLCFVLIISVACNDDNDNPQPLVDNYTKGTNWTVMYYCDADCDLETALLSDVQEMKSGYVNDQGLNLILLIDRHPESYGYYTNDATVFGEDFSDTRIYRITQGAATRIGGGTQFPEITTISSYEANMGDANTMKKFIQFCKAEYEADNYALILSNHGGGTRGRGLSDNLNRDFPRAFCEDDTNDGDMLYVAEVTDVLTASESVDLIGFDVCLLGSVETAYQYRTGDDKFSADYMVASSPSLWGAGWQYDKIFERIRGGGGNNGEVDTIIGGSELYYDPSTMTAAEFGGIIVEEQYDSTSANSTYGPSQSLSCYNLAKVAEVKDAVDALAVNLSVDVENEQFYFENIRGGYPLSLSEGTIHYFDAAEVVEWVRYPFFDLYDLCERTSTSSDFSSAIQTKASDVMTAVDEMVVYSYAGNDYPSRFTNGKHGLHIFFSDGDSINYLGERSWAYQWWYNSIDTDAAFSDDDSLYGKLSWCIDGATSSDSTIDNWFEMLDDWFDEGGGGGLNGYTP